MIREPGAASRPVSDEGVAPTLLPDAAWERRQRAGMSDTDRLPDEVFTVSKKGRRAAILGGLLFVAFAILLPLITDRKLTSFGFPTLAGFIVLWGIFTMKPAGTPVMKLSGEGVEILTGPESQRRILPWCRISDVEWRPVRQHESYPGERTRKGETLMIFRLGALPWAFRMPSGFNDGERVAEAIRKRIRPEIAAKRDTLDAATFFEVVFGIRLPETARTVHAEFHPENGTGLWAVKLSPEDLKALKAGEGTVSAFYPLLPEQRFHVGDRKLAGGSELRGDYAISPHDWNATPVLVVDREESVLHGLLTDAMA